MKRTLKNIALTIWCLFILTLWFFAIFTAKEPISTPPYQGFAQEKIQNTNFTISAQVVKKINIK